MSPNTTELIENTIRAVQESTNIANETADTLNLIAESAAAREELFSQAQRLKELVSGFRFEQKE